MNRIRYRAPSTSASNTITPENDVKVWPQFGKVRADLEIWWPHLGQGRSESEFIGMGVSLRMAGRVSDLPQSPDPPVGGFAAGLLESCRHLNRDAARSELVSGV